MSRFLRAGIVGLFFVLSISCLASSLTGCGKRPVRAPGTPLSQPDPIENADVETVATLVLFGAPWCANCKNEFPQIQSLIDQLPRERAEKLGFVLYVTTGATAQDQPSDEIANKYKEVLALKAKAFPDEWRWKAFRKYVGGNLVLPGAAILDANGNVLKSFRAGAATFVPSEIVKAAEDTVK